MVGICAMMKKSTSKPMTQILERLCKFDYIDVVIFPEEVILEEPVEKWPLCDCLISFHSKGKTLNHEHEGGLCAAPILPTNIKLIFHNQKLKVKSDYIFNHINLLNELTVLCSLDIHLYHVCQLCVRLCRVYGDESVKGKKKRSVGLKISI